MSYFFLFLNFVGIWPEGADGTDINACCRSNNCDFLVTGDDFGQVNFFNFPSTKPKVSELIISSIDQKRDKGSDIRTAVKKVTVNQGGGLS